MELIIWFLIGFFIGAMVAWNYVEQPELLRIFATKIEDKFRDFRRWLTYKLS
jgi:hypothetical protein